MIDVAEAAGTNLLIRPDAARWLAALQRFPAALSAEARTFRTELGLPVDRPVIITGHQAALWHPGILAKYLAVDAAARAAHAQPVWLVVDQDHNDPWPVRYPVKTATSSKSGPALSQRLWRADGLSSAAASALRENDVPVARRPAVAPAPLPALAAGESFASPGILAGLTTIQQALNAHRAAPSAAAQVSAALADLLRPLTATPATTLLATAISRTRLFADLVSRMQRDPLACVNAYNAAAARHPGARIAPLPIKNADPSAPDAELPLWHIGPAVKAPRRRACASMLTRVSVDELAPRALLMTGLLRWAGCDLFVHGTGGGGAGDADDSSGYDAITEEWFRAWLGVEIAPLAVASATLRLEFDVEPITPGQIALARWVAHRAAHDPALLGDETAATTKQSFVAQIRTTRDAKGDPHPLYLQMHALLDTVRRDRAPKLQHLEANAAAAAARRTDAAIIADRTWPFPLYQPAQLHALRDSIALALS